MAAKNKTASIDEQQVIDFLTQHTNFFNEHPELLLKLSLPYKDGKVLSLSQKQAEVLRMETVSIQKKYDRLEEEITTQINVVKENERISICLHRLSLKLLHKQEIESIVSETIKTLRAQFPSNQIVISLLPPYSNLSKTARTLDANDAVLKTLLASVFKLNKPDCSPLGSAVQKALFGNFAQRIRSSVVMPLRFHNQKLGLLLFGSPRPNAYTPGQSTMLLVQYGELIGTAIAACAETQQN